MMLAYIHLESHPIILYLTINFNKNWQQPTQHIRNWNVSAIVPLLMCEKNSCHIEQDRQQKALITNPVDCTCSLNTAATGCCFCARGEETKSHLKKTHIHTSYIHASRKEWKLVCVGVYHVRERENKTTTNSYTSSLCLSLTYTQFDDMQEVAGHRAALHSIWSYTQNSEAVINNTHIHVHAFTQIHTQMCTQLGLYVTNLPVNMSVSWVWTRDATASEGSSVCAAVRLQRLFFFKLSITSLTILLSSQFYFYRITNHNASASFTICAEYGKQDVSVI